MASFETHNRTREHRVRARILYPFILVVLFVIASFVFATYVHEDRTHKKFLIENVTVVDRLFHQGLEKDAATMFAALNSIAYEENLKTAFIGNNRDELLKRAWPIYDNLRKRYGITHFYFTGPDRVNFLRVHKPNLHGDVIDRITTMRAASAQESARGIELGPLGTFTLRVVLPWYNGKKLIGYLELGVEISHIIEDVSKTLGFELLVIVYDKFLKSQHWEKGREMLGHEDDWRRFGSTLVVGRAMEEIPKPLADILDKGEYTYDKVLQIIDKGRNLYVAFLPLTDISNREVGEFIVVQDVTSLRANFRQIMGMITILSILVGGIVFVIFYVILGRVDRDYKRQRETELQLSRVNTEHQKIIQVEKLSAMGLMIGEIAHQLNNPLAGVINMAQLAERGVNDPERTKKLLGEITKAGKDCHAFVKRMLEFTKLTCFDRKQTDMCVLLNETLALFKQSIGNHTKVVCNFPSESPMLDVDPVLIEHAVFNLLANAAQANPPEGIITLSLQPEFQEIDNVAGWSISVCDQGPGLADDIKEKIFTPFFTTRTEGTGLGLPVVLHVAILHEGEITMTNIEGGGANFALWLPNTRNLE